MEYKEKKFQPGEHKYRCLECEDIIWSKYSGEYVSCKCTAIAVDQTAYYTRYIGHPHLFKQLTSENDDNNRSEQAGDSL